MATIFEVYTQAMKEGKSAGVLSSDLRLLIAFDMGFAEPIDTLLRKDEEMTAVSKFQAQFARLLSGEPVEYIINEVKFLDYKLYVDERVLIPRMETQELVAQITERITEYYDPRNYLVCADIGTGSGAIAIALKGYFKNWLVSASDLSPDALAVAKKNFSFFAPNINVLEGPSLQPYIDARMNLDIIVSNPPYIKQREDVQDSVKNYEPESALYLEETNNVYLDIFRNYKKVKKGSLLMCFEIGYDLKDDLIGWMEEYLEDYSYEFVEDLNGLTRMLFVFCR